MIETPETSTEETQETSAAETAAVETTAETSTEKSNSEPKTLTREELREAARKQFSEGERTDKPPEQKSDSSEQKSEDAPEDKPVAKSNERPVAKKTNRSNDRIRELITKNKELTSKLAEYEAKAQRTELSVKDQYDVAALQHEQAEVLKVNADILKNYKNSLPPEQVEDFVESYSYYVPQLQKEAPHIIESIVKEAGENWTVILDTFMRCLNEGSEDLAVWTKLPTPAVKGKIRAAVEAYNQALAARESSAGEKPVAKKTPSIVPKQSRPEMDNPGTSEAYWDKLISDKLNGRR